MGRARRRGRAARTDEKRVVSGLREITIAKRRRRKRAVELEFDARVRAVRLPKPYPNRAPFALDRAHVVRATGSAAVAVGNWITLDLWDGGARDVLAPNRRRSRDHEEGRKEGRRG